MSMAYKKDLIFDDGTNIVALGGTQMKKDMKNKISSKPIAQQKSGETKNLALNLNRIEEQYVMSAKIDDETAAKLNGDIGSDTFTGDGSTKTFALSTTKGQAKVTIDGNYINPDRYVIDEANNEITFDVAPADGASIEVRHQLTKELADDRLEAMFKSQKIVTMDYGSDSYSGYIQQLSVTENSDEDGTVYSYKIRLLKAENLEDV